MASSVEEDLKYLTPQERAELDRLLATDTRIFFPNPGPQMMALESEADILGFGGAAGGGKAGSVNSLVLTPKGWRRFGDLQPGDALIDPTTGGSCQVIGVFPQGEQDLYEVETDDGATTRVVDWHLWAHKPCGNTNRRPATKASSQRKDAARLLGAQVEQTRWSTLRIGSTLDLQQQVAEGRNPRLPLMEPALFTVNGRTGTGVLEPYLLGLYLGDGCSTDISIASADDEVQDYLETQGFSGRLSVLAKNGRPISWGAVKNIRKQLDQWLRDQNLRDCRSWQKFIPNYVLTASVAYRLAFLQGLMDTDGTVDERGRAYFLSTSERLAQGVQALARSLGGKASIHLTATKRYTHKGEKRDGRPSWQVRVWMRNNSCLFRLSRKKARCTDRWNGGHELMREVVRVEKIGRGEAMCIAVSNPHGLYVTDDYLVTHNTMLISGLALTRHKRSVIFRQHKNQTRKFVQDFTKILGGSDGYTSQHSEWHYDGRLIEFAGLEDPADYEKQQGRDRDLHCYDEAAQMREFDVRYTMGWNRSDDPDQRCRVVLTFNPPTTAEGRWVVKFFAPWLDKTHPDPAADGELRWFTTIGDDQDYEVPGPEPFVLGPDRILVYDFDPVDYRPEQIIRPKSRTFISSRVVDNPYYMATGYISQLQQLPPVLRAQMLEGDFMAGIEDDASQVIPTAWIEAAQERWRRLVASPDFVKGPMASLGVDAARGGNMGGETGSTGKDKMVISPRHDAPGGIRFFDMQAAIPGVDVNTGNLAAAQVIARRRDDAPIHLDIIGIGTSVGDALAEQHMHVVQVNGTAKSFGSDKSGLLKFFNKRAEVHWRMREALDPEAEHPTALPPDPGLLADLAAPRWTLTSAGIKVEPKDDIKKRIGRSPDKGEACMYANIDTARRQIVIGGVFGIRQADSGYEAARLRELER